MVANGIFKVSRPPSQLAGFATESVRWVLSLLVKCILVEEKKIEFRDVTDHKIIYTFHTGSLEPALMCAVTPSQVSWFNMRAMFTANTSLRHTKAKTSVYLMHVKKYV